MATEIFKAMGKGKKGIPKNVNSEDKKERTLGELPSWYRRDYRPSMKGSHIDKSRVVDLDGPMRDRI